MATEHPAVTSALAPWSRLRLRRTELLRDLVAETNFAVAQLIQPLFVVEGLAGSRALAGLGEMERHGKAAALDSIARDLDAGVRHFMLFDVPSTKHATPPDARHLASTVAAIKQRFGSSLHLWVDVCLCSATTHGHCGLLDDAGEIDLVADTRCPRTRRGRGRRRGRRRRRPKRHDGRPDGARSRGAERVRSWPDADHELQHQVRQPVLRSLPRRRGLGAAVRQPSSLPTRRAVSARRDCVERPVRLRGRRPADGEAGDDLARSHRPDRGCHVATGRGLSGEW